MSLRQDGKDRYLVSGELVFDRVAAVWQEGHRMFTSGHRKINIDLADVSRSDSSGLALLIEWMREARNNGISLHFSNIPHQMKAVARASRLEHLLP